MAAIGVLFFGSPIPRWITASPRSRRRHASSLSASVGEALIDRASWLNAMRSPSLFCAGRAWQDCERLPDGGTPSNSTPRVRRTSAAPPPRPAAGVSMVLPRHLRAAAPVMRVSRMVELVGLSTDGVFPSASEAFLTEGGVPAIAWRARADLVGAAG